MLSVMTGEQGSRGSWRGVTSHGGNFLPVCETGHTLLISCSAEPATRRGELSPQAVDAEGARPIQERQRRRAISSARL